MRAGHGRVVLAVGLCLVLGHAPPVAGDPAEKADLLEKGGGTARSERAVTAGLVWLARHQEPDGSWNAEGFAARCTAPACAGKGYADYNVGLTGLVALAFLGAGYAPDSAAVAVDPVTARTVVLGSVAQAALDWLVKQQGPSGCVGPVTGSKSLYSHALATYALCEAHRLAPAVGYGAAAQKAVDFLLGARNPGSAWRYQPRSGENDTSVTTWCVMALKAAEAAGLKTDPSALAEVRAWIESITEPNFGKCGYMRLEDAGVKVVVQGKNEDFANHETMSAAGLLCRLAIPGAPKDPVPDLTAKILVNDFPAWDKARKLNDYYYWYHGTYALFHQDGPAGKYWKHWNPALQSALVDHQAGEGSGCAEGSWDADDRWGFEGGRIYATALNTLTLEVYYRCPWLRKK